MALLFEMCQARLAWEFYRHFPEIFWYSLHRLILNFELLRYDHDDQIVSIWEQVNR